MRHETATRLRAILAACCGACLCALGVETTATRQEGMFHGFLSFAESLGGCRRALADALR